MTILVERQPNNLTYATDHLICLRNAFCGSNFFGVVNHDNLRSCHNYDMSFALSFRVVIFFSTTVQPGSSACTPLWEFWGCKNFSVQNPSEKSIPSFLPTQAVVTRASRALLPDKVGRGVKIHGKMGKPGPDAIFLGFCEIVGGSKKFSCARFFISHWGVFPRAKRAEKNFKVYLRERSERKITLSTHA